jgi:diadenosine tetraphosphate (Ap4A) HIT family hydrolase
MPWPENFDAMKRGEGCAMCEEGRPDENSLGIRFAEGRYSDAYLQKEAMQLGWSVVVWRGPHVVEAHQLSYASADYWDEVTSASRAVEAHFRPVKLNVMQLGNSLPHLHTHIVPRYEEDANLGGPFVFPTGDVGEWPTEELRADVEALRGLVARETEGSGRGGT